MQLRIVTLHAERFAVRRQKAVCRHASTAGFLCLDIAHQIHECIPESVVLRHLREDIHFIMQTNHLHIFDFY